MSQIHQNFLKYYFSFYSYKNTTYPLPHKEATITMYSENQLSKLMKEGKRDFTVYDCKGMIKGGGEEMPTPEEERQFGVLLRKVATQNGLEITVVEKTFPGRYTLGSINKKR